MAAITQELLERVGVEISPDDFESLVVEALQAMPAARRAQNSAASLAPAEAAALRRGGFNLEHIDLGDADPVARTAAAYAALIASSLTVPETARRLNIDDSRVRQRLAARTLYGIKLRDGWRLPLWQFDGDALLPGIAEVVSRLDPALHPIAVQTWMLTPSADLADDEHAALSPRDWLRTGHDPEEVAAFAAALGRGI